MDVARLLKELFDRIPPLVRGAVEGLDREDLAWRAAPEANTIGWLAWHIGRVQDAQIAAVTGEPQVWESGVWPHRVGLDPDPSDTGYGHTPEQVAAVLPAHPDALVGYVEAVHGVAVAFLGTLGSADLERIVDRRWDPPVSLGVRLVSIAGDCLQHAGQAAYVRGLLGRR